MSAGTVIEDRRTSAHRPRAAALLLPLALALAFAIMLATAASAQADDCASLGGVVVGSGESVECQVAAPVSASGAYNVATALRITATGRIVVPPLPAGNSLTLNVNGALTIEVPATAGAAAIVGDADAFGPNPGGIAATLTIAATGDVVLQGNGTSGAIVSANSDPTGCSGSGKAGTIVIGSTRGHVTLQNGARIEASGQCPAGEISIVSDDGDVRVDGVVEAASGNSVVGGTTRPRGGPITIAAACKLTIDINGRVSSRGLEPGSDLVHLESGCDTEILGRVESIGGIVPDGLPNRCTGPFRPGKPADATACVEVWSGGKLAIRNLSPNNGSVMAETGSGLMGFQGVCCSWVDLFAKGDITVDGKATVSRSAYAVSARQLASSAKGGFIDVKSLNGKITSQGRAFNADAANAEFGNGVGGKITLEAAGPVTQPASLLQAADVRSNVDLADSSVRAVGGLSIPDGRGSIVVRSYNGQITGGGLTAGVPDTNKGHLNASGGGSAVVIDMRLCIGDLYVGPITPSATRTSALCGGGPTPPDFVDIPVYLPRPTIDVTGGVFVFDSAPHPATATALGAQGELLSPVTIAYTDQNAAPVTVPVNPGTYTAVASFPGNAAYRSASATATITIIPSTTPQPTVTVTGGTYTYDRMAHPAIASATGPNGEPLAVVITYNGSTTPPVNAGVYAVVASFPGSLQYQPASAQTTITINRALATVSVASFSAVYDGNAHPASGAVVGVGGESLGTPTFTYNGSPVPPQHTVGTYAVVGTFGGNGNYNAATASGTITLTPATPLVVIDNATYPYTGLPRGATGTVIGVSGEVLSGLTFTYNGSPAAPVNPGAYPVVGTFTGGGNYGPASGTGSLVILASPVTISVTGGEFFFDGQPHPATGTVTGVNGELLTPLTFTYNGSATPPVNPGSYQVVGTFPGNGVYGPATGTATITIRSTEATEACLLVDFREITYFRNSRVLTSSDAGIRQRNGISGPFNPALWPYDANGASGHTRSRGTLFRIYGFTAAQLGIRIPDADRPVSYEVVGDPAIPGAYYIDLGGKPARVRVCIDQLQTQLIDGSAGEPGQFPGTTKLTDAQRNVPGVMLTHNAARLAIPERVRSELRALGTPLVDGSGREIGYGYVDYVGVQLWGHGDESLREFVDVQISFVNDDATDRRRHYEHGFHTVRNGNFESLIGCNYLDQAPGNDGARFNDVWDGTRVGDPDWGPACGRRELGQNQRTRADYAVPFNAVQLLTTVNTHDDTVRIFFGQIRPVMELNRTPELASPGPRTVTVGSPLRFTLQASDRDGDAPTYGANGLPTGATLDPRTGAFAWTPTASQVGAFTITFRATDRGGLRDSETVTFTVKPASRPGKHGDDRDDDHRYGGHDDDDRRHGDHRDDDRDHDRHHDKHDDGKRAASAHQRSR